MHFREFDLNVVNFINLDIELAEIVPDTGAVMNQPAVRIKPHLFYMVISDFNQKAAHVLKGNNATAAKVPGFGPPAWSLSSKPSRIKLFLSKTTTKPHDLVNIYYFSFVNLQ